MSDVTFCQSLTRRDKVVSLMFRDKTYEEVLSYKHLLLGIVRLIHADPNLMLNVRTVILLYLCMIYSTQVSVCGMDRYEGLLLDGWMPLKLGVGEKFFGSHITRP